MDEMNMSLIKNILIYLTALVFITGCQTVDKNRIVEPQTIISGDKVLVDFTCRLKDGGIVMTTDGAVANNKNKAKAGIFLPFKNYGPEPIIAGSGRKGPDFGRLKTLENEIFENLSLAVVGMEEGVTGYIAVKSDIMPGLAETDRFITLSRVINKLPKYKQYEINQFKESLGKEPVAGKTIVIDEQNGISMKILLVEENKVEVIILMKDGTRLDFPHGEAVVYDDGDYYKAILDIHEGDLIRSGAIVGSISEVDELSYTIDYGHPFGGETLVCDVTAKKEATADEKNQKQ